MANDAATGNPEPRPTGTLPSETLPSETLPSETLPSETLPTGTLPTGTLPTGTLPSETLPTGTLPTGALPIVLCGEPVLRRAAGPVDPARLRRGDLAELIAAMRVTMEAAPGVGLAAPQIGEPLQLAIMADDPERWGQLTEEQLAARERTALPFTVLVNPELSPVDGCGLVSFYEGCLSVPGLAGVVARHRSVRVDALDEHGAPFSTIFSGWPARIAQHEIDHLRGILYLDRVETRSLTTFDNFAAHWAGRPPGEAAAELGFQLER